MHSDDFMTLTFVQQLIETPVGRAHLLNQIATAEDNGESQIFDRALAKVDDPKLQKMIERHRADEVRHGKLFRDAAEKTGVKLEPVPEELQILHRIDRALGGFFQKPLADDQAVADAYLILQAIEERAVNQFSLFELAFREVDLETAAILAEVSADERRHLKYCAAIAKKYQPDDQKREAALARFRIIEAEAFRDNSQANLQYMLERGVIHGTVRRTMWRVVGWVGQTLGLRGLPLTTFARSGLRVAAAEAA